MNIDFLKDLNSNFTKEDYLNKFNDYLVIQSNTLKAQSQSLLENVEQLKVDIKKWKRKRMIFRVLCASIGSGIGYIAVYFIFQFINK